MVAFAQGTSPWENAVSVLKQAFTSTIARGLSLVAIVVAGFAFAEGGSATDTRATDGRDSAMNCYIYPATPATATGQSCGRRLCSPCSARFTLLRCHWRREWDSNPS